MGEILAQFPPDAELEVELTHRLWVLTFKHFGPSPAHLAEALEFLEPHLAKRPLVSADVGRAVKQGLLARRQATTFTMCQDAGRYMTKENSMMLPPGEVATKRLEVVKSGVFILHRAVGSDGRMQSENDDLLEARWPCISGRRCLVFQDRFRDITYEEMSGLESWANALSRLDGFVGNFDPLSLASDDPGMFWSSVRHKAIMAPWPEALRKGRDDAWKLRAKVEERTGSKNLDFPSSEDREAVALAALAEILQQFRQLPGGDVPGLEVNIIGNESEKGSIAAMTELEHFTKLPGPEREKILAKDKAMKEKVEKKRAQRREQGKPETSCQLTGQERCCWSCGNVEHTDRPLFQCQLCGGYLCSVPACCSLHPRFCFGRDAEPESEDDIIHGGVVECVVLPGDQHIKPYVRPLPKSKPAAEKALREILRCDAFLVLTPLRAFQNGWSDPLDDGSRIAQHLGNIQDHFLVLKRVDHIMMYHAYIAHFQLLTISDSIVYRVLISNFCVLGGSPF